jgi:hypothetical protein
VQGEHDSSCREKVGVVEVIGNKGRRVVWLGEAWHSFVMGEFGG